MRPLTHIQLGDGVEWIWIEVGKVFRVTFNLCQVVVAPSKGNPNHVHQATKNVVSSDLMCVHVTRHEANLVT